MVVKLRRARGLTLIEVMVVVTIIGILAVSGTLNVLRARMMGNEAVTIANMRQLAVALQSYNSVNNAYPDPLGLLSDATPAYAPTSITGGTGGNGNTNLNGYTYVYAWIDNFHYTVITSPTTQGVTGVRRFYVDQTSALRFTVDGTAPDANSPLIQ